MPLETDVEEFVRRVDTIVSDVQVETRPGSGIIEETVDFPPGEFVIERGRLGIQTRNTKTTSLPCSVPDMVCDSIESLKLKCGFTEYGTVSKPPIIYSTKTVVTSIANSEFISNDGCGGSGTAIDSLNVTDVYSVDPLTCKKTCVGSGSAARDYDLTGIGDPGSSKHCIGSRTSTCGSMHGTTTQIDCGVTTVPPGTPWTNSDISFGGESIPNSQCVGPGGTLIQHQTTTTNTLIYDNGNTVGTLSDEYDNESLKQNARAALPPYSEKYNCTNKPPFQPGQNCLCVAQTYLSDDDPHASHGAPCFGTPCYFMRRFKYKFVFPDGASAQPCQVLEWDEAFTPDNGHAVTGIHHSFVCDGGETEIGPFECFERDTNGTATITNFETFCQLPCPDMSCPPCA